MDSACVLPPLARLQYNLFCNFLFTHFRFFWFIISYPFSIDVSKDFDRSLGLGSVLKIQSIIFTHETHILTIAYFVENTCRFFYDSIAQSFYFRLNVVQHLVVPTFPFIFGERILCVQEVVKYQVWKGQHNR